VFGRREKDSWADGVPSSRSVPVWLKAIFAVDFAALIRVEGALEDFYPKI